MDDVWIQLAYGWLDISYFLHVRFVHLHPKNLLTRPLLDFPFSRASLRIPQEMDYGTESWHHLPCAL